MVSNRACAVVILILWALFALSQVLRAEVPAIQGVVGAPLLLLGPGWAIMRFVVPGLHLFEAIVAVTLSITVWTLTALLLLNLHAWQPLAAVDVVLAVVAFVALFSLQPSRTERPA
jgi:accessory gene regulator protein AgrB